MTTQHQICPARRSKHAPGTAIVCSICRMRVLITTEQLVPEHKIRCGATVYHKGWPDKCSRWAVARGFCKLHAPYTPPVAAPEAQDIDTSATTPTQETPTMTTPTTGACSYCQYCFTHTTLTSPVGVTDCTYCQYCFSHSSQPWPNGLTGAPDPQTPCTTCGESLMHWGVAGGPCELGHPVQQQEASNLI